MKNKVGLCLMSVISLCSAQLLASEFYVSPSGDDVSPGTKGKPFKTLAKAVVKARAGDTIILRQGTYRETLRFQNSGTEDKPLTFMAAVGEKVLLFGTELVKNWKPYKGKIMQAKISKALEPGFNQVFLDGKMMPMARFPNEKSDDLLKPNLGAMEAQDNTITSKLLSQPDGFWNGGYVVGGFGHKWTFQCAKIKDYKKGKLELIDKSKPWFKGKGVGYVFGVLGALDTPAEWFIKDNSIYFWPPDGIDLKSAQVEVKQRTLAIDFNGKSHVIVNGINVTVASILMVGNGNILENCTVTYPSHFTRFKWSGYATNGGVNEGHNGILLKGNNNTIKGCNIQFSAGSGIVIQGRENLVASCEISNIDYSGTYSCPIALCRAKDNGKNKIWFNSIHRAGRDCIQMYGATADDIRYNDIYDTGMICKDLGMVYVWGRDGKGTRIAYNWIHDNRAPRPNPGVYLDNFCRNFIVDHNVIWNCEAGVRVNGPAEGHQIYHNTLFKCKEIGTHTFHVWPPKDFIKAAWPKKIYQYENTNNLYLGNKPEEQLMDVEKRQFQLKKDAKAIDVGKEIPGFTAGFKGKAPDLGAYESGVPNWIPGKDGKK